MPAQSEVLKVAQSFSNDEELMHEAHAFAQLGNALDSLSAQGMQPAMELWPGSLGPDLTAWHLHLSI